MRKEYLSLQAAIREILTVNIDKVQIILCLSLLPVLNLTGPLSADFGQRLLPDKPFCAITFAISFFDDRMGPVITGHYLHNTPQGGRNNFKIHSSVSCFL